MKKAWLILPLLLTTQHLHAAPETYTLDSPYAALHTFLSGLDAQNYRPKLAAQVFLQPGISLQEATSIAKKLKEILEINGVRIVLENVPNDPNYHAPDGELKYLLAPTVLPNVFLRRSAHGLWLFSDMTIHNIDKLYAPIARKAPRQLVNRFKHPAWHLEVLHIAVWQYTLLTLFLFLSWLIQLLMGRLVSKLLVLFLVLTKNTLTLAHYRRYGWRLGRAIGHVCSSSLFLNILLPAVKLNVEIGHYILLAVKLWRSISIASTGYILINLMSYYWFRAAKEGRVGHLDIIPLVERTTKVMLFIMSFLFVLHAFGIETKSLFASLGLGSLGLALASQDAFRNLFGSIMIFLDRPFKVGDFIITRDAEGVVQEVGMRSTSIKTKEGSRISVPNSNLANANIINRGSNTYQDYRNQILLALETPIDQVNAFIEGFQKIIAEDPHTLKGRSQVTLTDIRERGYEITYTLFFSQKDPYKELMYRHAVLVKVIQMASELGLNFL